MQVQIIIETHRKLAWFTHKLFPICAFGNRFALNDKNQDEFKKNLYKYFLKNKFGSNDFDPFKISNFNSIKIEAANCIYQFQFIADTREKNEAFGSSLLLANSPMSPKIVNGSFAAIFDADEFLAKTYAGIRIAVIPPDFYALSF